MDFVWAGVVGQSAKSELGGLIMSSSGLYIERVGGKGSNKYIKAGTSRDQSHIMLDTCITANHV